MSSVQYSVFNSNMKRSLNLCFCCFSLLLVENVYRNYECNAVDLSATTAVDMMVQYWFPDQIVFNESCVLEGCPGLNNITLCPNDVDVDRLYSFFNLVSSCMKGRMCGILVDKRPILPMVVSTDEILLNTSITGLLSTVPDTGYLSNISNIQVELSPGQSGRLPLQIMFMVPSMRAQGQIQLQLTVPMKWTTILGQNIAVNLSNTYYDAGYQFMSTVSLNSSAGASPIQIEFLNPVVKASCDYDGLDMPPGLPDIVQLVNEMSKFHMEKSKFAKAKASLLQKLYQSALNIVSKHCQLDKNND